MDQRGPGEDFDRNHNECSSKSNIKHSFLHSQQTAQKVKEIES